MNCINFLYKILVIATSHRVNCKLFTSWFKMSCLPYGFVVVATVQVKLSKFRSEKNPEKKFIFNLLIYCYIKTWIKNLKRKVLVKKVLESKVVMLTSYNDGFIQHFSNNNKRTSLL